MQRILGRALAAVAVVLVVGSCGTEDITYPGGTAGPAVAIDITTSLFELRAGETVTIGMQGRDEAGNPVTASTPTIASGDNGVVSVAAGPADEEWAATATVTAAGMGETTITVTLGSLTEVLTARVGPGTVRITGDPIVGFDALATDPSVNTFQFGFDAFDLSGGAASGTADLEWTSSDTDIFTVDRATGEIVSQDLGTAMLHVRGHGGGNASVLITVAAPALNGTASISSGTQGFLVTLTRNAGEVDFDANTEAYFDFGAFPAFVDGFTASTITIAIPATGKAGRQDIVLRNVGPNDVDRRVVFDITDGSTDDRWNNADGTVAPDFDAVASPGGAVYFTYGPGTGVIYSGTSPDNWFAISGGASGRTVDVTFEWMGVGGSQDADLFICSATGPGSCSAIAASQDYNPPNPPIESILGLVIPASTTYYIVAVNFADQGATYANAKISVQ